VPQYQPMPYTPPHVYLPQYVPMPEYHVERPHYTTCTNNGGFTFCSTN
jgi:hypothetical protein